MIEFHELATEQEVIEVCKKLNNKELDDMFSNYDYEFDENESTSRNIREFAEYIVSLKDNMNVTAYLSEELQSDEEYPYLVLIEQEDETKEYESFATREEAEKRVEHINNLKTSDWEKVA